MPAPIEIKPPGVGVNFDGNAMLGAGREHSLDADFVPRPPQELPPGHMAQDGGVRIGDGAEDTLGLRLAIKLEASVDAGDDKGGTLCMLLAKTAESAENLAQGLAISKEMLDEGAQMWFEHRKRGLAPRHCPRFSSDRGLSGKPGLPGGCWLRLWGCRVEVYPPPEWSYQDTPNGFVAEEPPSSAHRGECPMMKIKTRSKLVTFRLGDIAPATLSEIKEAAYRRRPLMSCRAI